MAGGTPTPAPGTLAGDLEAIFNDPRFAQSHWGVDVRSLEDGRTLYQRNADRLFVPASNMKLLTGAAALEALGPEYRYRTVVAANGPIIDGVLQGSLVIFGNGDPTFSERFHRDSRDAFRSWADSLLTRGVRRISGGVIAVDSAFHGPHYGSGWAWDDLLTASAAPYGAIQFNEGVFALEIFPSSNAYQPGIVILDPPTQAVRVINDTRTLVEGSITAIRVMRDEAGTGVIVRGEIPADAGEITRTVAVDDPARYFATVLRETLREQGLAVEGPAIIFSELAAFDPSIANTQPLFTYESPPMTEILAAMMKPSQNQIAETLLVTLGRELRNDGTAESGAAVVDSILRTHDVQPLSYRMADGSGLSRYNLLSPALLVDLLATMDRSAMRDIWLESLPVAGREGTLANRMSEPPLLDRVVAKTGTLSGIRSLSGYLTTVAGERVAFSIIVNNHLLPATEADALIEAALTRIAEGN